MVGQTRREFLLRAGCGAAVALAFGAKDLLAPAANAAAQKGYIGSAEARHYERLGGGRVRCRLCPHQCEVGDNERGYCGVRENRNGKYYTLVYGNPCVIHDDQLAKKPILHAIPGGRALTIATAGCNLACRYCQNWEISQERPEGTSNFALSPDAAVAAARDGGQEFIAFDYNDPVIFFEYAVDTARAARAAGVKTAVCTAAYIQPEPLAELCQVADVIKVDLKGFSEDFYWDLCYGTLQPVLEATKIVLQHNTWLELVNLIVPTHNDDMAKIREMCLWIKGNLGPDVPLTFSRFTPMYQLVNLPPTPQAILEEARKTAQDVGLRYVYLGNVTAATTSRNTYCPGCGKLAIQRLIYDVRQNNLKGGKCKYCGRLIPGVWK